MDRELQQNAIQYLYLHLSKVIWLFFVAFELSIFRNPARNRQEDEMDRTAGIRGSGNVSQKKVLFPRNMTINGQLYDMYLIQNKTLKRKIDHSSLYLRKPCVLIVACL